MLFVSAVEIGNQCYSSTATNSSFLIRCIYLNFVTNIFDAKEIAIFHINRGIYIVYGI